MFTGISSQIHSQWWGFHSYGEKWVATSTDNCHQERKKNHHSPGTHIHRFSTQISRMESSHRTLSQVSGMLSTSEERTREAHVVPWGSLRSWYTSIGTSYGYPHSPCPYTGHRSYLFSYKISAVLDNSLGRNGGPHPQFLKAHHCLHPVGYPSLLSSSHTHTSSINTFLCPVLNVTCLGPTALVTHPPPLCWSPNPDPFLPIPST